MIDRMDRLDSLHNGLGRHAAVIVPGDVLGHATMLHSTVGLDGRSMTVAGVQFIGRRGLGCKRAMSGKENELIEQGDVMEAPCAG